MADNEDESGSGRTITAAEPPCSPAQTHAADSTQPENSALPETVAPSTDPTESTPAATVEEREERSPAVSGEQSDHPVELPEGVSAAAPAVGESQLVDFLQGEQSILVGAELSSLAADMSNTTIIYVQPDGSLMEGSGLTAEEQQALLEQLSKQQVVQVSDSEAVQLLQQSQVVKSSPVHSVALNPSQLQQVISQVSGKTQQQVQIPQQPVQKIVQVQTPQQAVKQVVQVHTPQQVVQQAVKQLVQVQPLQQAVKQVVQAQSPQQVVKQVVQVQNASQHLKTVAQQAALQGGGSSASTVHLTQSKPEPVRIQIQAPPKQEVKPRPASQQHNSQSLNQPQVTLSTNGTTQIIHIQPMVAQQGQQLFLQQNLGDAPIQLLLQSPAPVVGSLLPVVHKLPAPASAAKTPPAATPIVKLANVSLLKPPANGTASSPSKSPVKQTAALPVQASPPGAGPPAPVASTTVKDRDKEKVRKQKKKDKKAVKVQTRSGRVSRPPKYKAKDYKFIKTEDLAESHQSDSDDYSDMSTEDEERKDGTRDADTSLTYSHKSRAHPCQTCDKAYIGLGGLNRHYKLNPSHGEPELAGDVPPQTDPDDGQVRLVPTELTAATMPDAATEEETEEKSAVTATDKEPGPAASAGGFRGVHHRGPGRPRGRGRGRGRGRSLGVPPKVSGGLSLMGRRGRPGRPPKQVGGTVSAELQAERRRERLQELVDQCEDEELMDIVLPRLTKVLSVWEMLLAKVERTGPPRTHFPDVYHEFESLQAQVRQAAQDYIAAPQGGAAPLEVRNIEVARSLGILDEVNRMKVLPGTASASGVSNKSSRYMENSKMLPPSKRFKMENSVPLQHNGIERAAASSAAPVATSLAPVTPTSATPLLPTEAKPSAGPTQAPAAATPMEVTTAERQATEAPVPPPATESPAPVVPAQEPEKLPETCLVQEGQEIYIETDGLSDADGIVIVNGPDGTTMHIQTPEGVPLEAVQALLGIESGDPSKAS
ncbi:protein split ends isoform X2 [Syngnathus scovelli]|uniref:protein split ends isoform X2 n=1 Tax=Syngnathus scovelli TaxID=161590 RepID=UPI002110E203|nr:uncharacterized protein znf839 isoform X2 [Syngnathus scovelli]